MRCLRAALRSSTSTVSKMQRLPQGVGPSRVCVSVSPAAFGLMDVLRFDPCAVWRSDAPLVDQR